MISARRSSSRIDRGRKPPGCRKAMRRFRVRLSAGRVSRVGRRKYRYQSLRNRDIIAALKISKSAPRREPGSVGVTITHIDATAWRTAEVSSSRRQMYGGQLLARCGGARYHSAADAVSVRAREEHQLINSNAVAGDALPSHPRRTPVKQWRPNRRCRNRSVIRHGVVVCLQRRKDNRPCQVG